jgi:hypothetical protein
MKIKILLISLLLLSTKGVMAQNDIMLRSNDINLTIQIDKRNDSLFFTPTIFNHTSKSILITEKSRLSQIGLGVTYFYFFGTISYNWNYIKGCRDNIILMELLPKQKYKFPTFSVSKSDLNNAKNEISVSIEYLLKNNVKYKRNKDNNVYVVKYKHYVDKMIYFESVFKLNTPL